MTVVYARNLSEQALLVCAVCDLIALSHFVYTAMTGQAPETLGAYATQAIRAQVAQSLRRCGGRPPKAVCARDRRDRRRGPRATSPRPVGGAGPR